MRGKLSAAPWVSSMSPAHFLWDGTSSTERPISLVLRLSNSALRAEKAPSSVVHTGVKSLGWEKRMPQLSPSQSWKLMVPSVVSAVKSGAVSPRRIAIDAPFPACRWCASREGAGSGRRLRSGARAVRPSRRQVSGCPHNCRPVGSRFRGGRRWPGRPPLQHAVTVVTNPVRVEREGPVTVVVIDRPERRNAVDRATAAGLLEAFEEFDADAAAAVAVLTGSGGTFCAGADLKAVAAGGGNRVTVDGPGPLGPTRLELSK